jgi:hypothetical protein
VLGHKLAVALLIWMLLAPIVHGENTTTIMPTNITASCWNTSIFDIAVFLTIVMLFMVWLTIFMLKRWGLLLILIPLGILVLFYTPMCTELRAIMLLLLFMGSFVALFI